MAFAKGYVEFGCNAPWNKSKDTDPFGGEFSAVFIRRRPHAWTNLNVAGNCKKELMMKFRTLPSSFHSVGDRDEVVLIHLSNFFNFLNYENVLIVQDCRSAYLAPSPDSREKTTKKAFILQKLNHMRGLKQHHGFKHPHHWSLSRWLLGF